MNWIEIDKWLVGLMRASKDDEQLYRDAMKKFSWSRNQAEAAIKPLLNRNTLEPKSLKSNKKVAGAAKPAINKTRKGKR